MRQLTRIWGVTRTGLNRPPRICPSAYHARFSSRAVSIRQPFSPTNVITPVTARWNSSLTVPESESTRPKGQERPPSYQLTFTCKPCSHRSAHMVSKQGYHHGTVLITCPSCKNRHVISDHLKIFMDEKSTLEDILKRTAEDGNLTKLLKKGRLGMREGQMIANEGEEDIEFWDDGSMSEHKPT